jgi:hypothetical protein
MEEKLELNKKRMKACERERLKYRAVEEDL